MAGPYHALSTDTSVPHQTLDIDTAIAYHTLSTDSPVTEQTAASTSSACSSVTSFSDRRFVQPALQPKRAVRPNPRITLNNPVFAMVGPDNLIDGMSPAIMWPALQLVSHYLLSPAAMKFIYTVAFTPADPVPETEIRHRMHSRPAFEFRREPSELTPEQQRQAAQALDGLADDLAIGIMDAPRGAHGRTTYPYRRTKALITLSRQMYNRVAAAAVQQRWDDHAGLIVELASVILHELGHAILLLTKPKGDYYFPSATGAAALVSEAGFELQRRVLGGWLHRMQPKRQAISARGKAREPDTGPPPAQMILCLWPDPSLISSYIACKCCVGVRGTQAELGEQRSTQPVVPFEYVLDVLREEFWEAVGREDEKAVWPMCIGEVKIRMGMSATRLRWHRLVGEVKRKIDYWM